MSALSIHVRQVRLHLAVVVRVEADPLSPAEVQPHPRRVGPPPLAIVRHHTALLGGGGGAGGGAGRGEVELGQQGGQHLGMHVSHSRHTCHVSPCHTRQTA